MRGLVLEITAFVTLLLVLVSAGWWARGVQEARRADTEIQEILDGYRQQIVQLRTVTDRAQMALAEQRLWHAAQRQRLEAWLALPDPDCSIDAAGVELWNAANAGADAGAATTGAVGPVPPSVSVARRPGAHVNDQSPGDDAGAGRLRPSSGGTGRMEPRGE